MIDFKDMRPEWEIGFRNWTRADVRELGASDALIDWLTHGNRDSDRFMVRPEEWFWRDRDWFGKLKDPICMTEMHAISGGTFCAMSLEAQCDMLGISLTTIKGEKVKGSRGKWAGRNGPVTVEQFALEQLQDCGASGFAVEGLGYAAWGYARSPVAKQMRKKKIKIQEVNGGFFDFIPGAESVQLYRDALMVTRKNIDLIHAKYKGFPNLWGSFTLEDAKAFGEVLGWDVFEQIDGIYYMHATNCVVGWPDITVRRNGELEFIEVKSNDRLRGNQARWVANVARPLNLKVSVCRVIE